MANGFFRERKHYRIHDIAKELNNISIEEAKHLVGILKKYGVVKAVKASKPEYEDLSNVDIVLTDVVENNEDIEYIFDFVGVIMLEQQVFKCYPKYIHSSNEPIDQLKQILKVIKKYNEKEQLVHLFNGEDEDKLFNRLAVSLHLLEDYFQNGVYTNQHDVIETNGEGEILWDKTINETFAYIQNNRPYYVELQTINSVDNEMDYFRRLHECVISQCSRELCEAGLLDLFELSEAELTNSILDDFGDIDYIKYRLENEIKQQFVTRKQILLKTLYTYVSNAKVSQEDLSYSLYGTNSFNLVWEDVCKHNFKNCLDKRVEDLPTKLRKKLSYPLNAKLIELIEKPEWTQNEPFVFAKADTLKPDLVSIYSVEPEKEYCFAILDAKYYCIDFKKTKGEYRVQGNPGVADVTKQYLYQLAYENFIDEQGYKYTLNAFLCPKEKVHENYGLVEMRMMQKVLQGNSCGIYVVKLCAEDMYKLYISNKYIDDPGKYLPDVVWLNALSKISLGKNGDINKDRIIYPISLKRKAAARLIYDELYPFINKTYYSHENNSGQHVAEDDLASKRELLAKVALEFEENLSRWTDEQLEDMNVIMQSLAECFNGKDEIQELLNNDNIEKTAAGLTEVLRRYYA